MEQGNKLGIADAVRRGGDDWIFELPQPTVDAIDHLHYAGRDYGVMFDAVNHSSRRLRLSVVLFDGELQDVLDALRELWARDRSESARVLYNRLRRTYYERMG